MKAGAFTEVDSVIHRHFYREHKENVVLIITSLYDEYIDTATVWVPGLGPDEVCVKKEYLPMLLMNNVVQPARRRSAENGNPICQLI